MNFTISGDTIKSSLKPEQFTYRGKKCDTLFFFFSLRQVLKSHVLFFSKNPWFTNIPLVGNQNAFFIFENFYFLFFLTIIFIEV